MAAMARPSRAGSSTLGIMSRLAAEPTGAVEPRIPLAAGLIVASAGPWLMSTLEPSSAHPGHALPTLVLIAGGLGAAFVPVMALATGGAEERDGGWPRV